MEQSPLSLRTTLRRRHPETPCIASCIRSSCGIGRQKTSRSAPSSPSRPSSSSCRGWFSWFEAHEDFRECRAPLFLVLLHLGVRAGWWASIDDAMVVQSKCLRNDMPEEFASVAGGGENIVPQEPVARPTIAQSNEDLKKVRASCANGLHFMAQILSNALSTQLSDVVAFVGRHVRRDFQSAVASCMTAAGTKARAVQLSSCGYNQVLAKTLLYFHSPDILADIGYTAAADADYLCDGEKSKEYWAVVLYFELVISTVRERYLRNMFYTHSLPGRFAALLGESSAEAMANCRRWWGVLQAIDQKKAADPSIQAHFQASLWPLVTFPREILTRLLEGDWQPPLLQDVSQHLEAMCTCILHTDVVEKCLNVLTHLQSGTSEQQHRSSGAGVFGLGEGGARGVRTTGGDGDAHRQAVLH